MKKQLLLCALIGCALPVAPALAQLDGARTAPARAGELPFRQISPDQALALTTAKSITLNLRDVTLRAALQELTRQSGATIEFSSNVNSDTLDKKLSLKLENRSLRQAFDAIIEEVGVNAMLQRSDNNGAYTVRWNQTSADTKAPQNGVGPFQIQLQSLALNSSKTVDLRSPAQPMRSQNETLNVQLRSIDDLRTAPIGQPAIRLTRADDEKGRSLLLPERTGYRMMRFQNFSMPVQLSAPTVGAQKLALLEGEATYVLGSKNLIWELPDIVNSKGSVHEFESEGQKIRVEVESAQIGRDSVSVNLKVTAAKTAAQNAAEDKMKATNIFTMRLANPLISADVLMPALRIEDANGQVLRSNGMGASGSNNEVSIRTQFFAASNMNNGGKAKLEVVGPLKLVFDGPVEFVQTQVPFAFKDVPLP